jgi:hypothetical protein
MSKKDSYTAMDDSIPKRPGQLGGSKAGDPPGGIKKNYWKTRKKKAAKKSAKKA